MAEKSAGWSPLVQIGSSPQSGSNAACAPVAGSTTTLWLQIVTLGWMLIECGASLFAAVTRHSPALLAFGSDSLVELLSASVVLLRYFWPGTLSERAAGRVAAALLVALAVIVMFLSIASLTFHHAPEASHLGVAVTIAALVVMPLLAYFKRREARRTANVALAADAMQSATCAWLALITLAGLAANAAFHVPWVDGCAALLALPFLLKEARSAWRGQACGCC